MGEGSESNEGSKTTTRRDTWRHDAKSDYPFVHFLAGTFPPGCRFADRVNVVELRIPRMPWKRNDEMRAVATVQRPPPVPLAEAFGAGIGGSADYDTRLRKFADDGDEACGG